MLIVQFTAVECAGVNRSGKDPIYSEFHGTNRKEPVTNRNLNNRASFQPTKVAPVKAIDTNPPTSKKVQASNYVPRPVPGERVAGYPTIVSPEHKSLVERSVTLPPRNNHWIPPIAHRGRRAVVRRSRRTVRFRRRVRHRRKTRRRRRRQRRSSTTPIPPTIIHSTTATTQNRSEGLVYRKYHPCNVDSSKMKYNVTDIECRRWRTTDLQQRMNCLGNFNHQYLATSLKEALNFRDPETGGKFNFSHSFVMNQSLSGSGSTRKRRDLHIEPGETLIVKCYAAKTPTESGHLRMCPVCTAITRQPPEPRRFPEYINELVCDPTAQSNYIPGIDGFCIQKTFTLDLLQFDGDWEKNSELSKEAGHDVYTEKWEPYTLTIRRHCACELLPSSPIAPFL